MGHWGMGRQCHLVHAGASRLSALGLGEDVRGSAPVVPASILCWVTCVLGTLHGHGIKSGDPHKAQATSSASPAPAQTAGAGPGDAYPPPQELFKKVVPYHCLGSIWSQRDKKGKEHLAPTIRATVTQFNSVANCVITTCLGDRSTKAPDRARVVEHWIEVARVRHRRAFIPSLPSSVLRLWSAVQAPVQAPVHSSQGHALLDFPSPLPGCLGPPYAVFLG